MWWGDITKPIIYDIEDFKVSIRNILLTKIDNNVLRTISLSKFNQSGTASKCSTWFHWKLFLLDESFLKRRSI